MRRKLLLALGITVAMAGPGAGVARADFVCPVLPVSEQATEHSNANFITISGGDTSILPGKAGDATASPVDVPAHATNMVGAGSPAVEHGFPGDPWYRVIWERP
jgi:hypothetical protein